MSQSLPTTLPKPVSTKESNGEVISRFLESFSSRETFLQTIRGAATALVVLLGCVCVIMAIDCAISISDSVRWSLTCIAYGASFLAGWLFGLKRVFLSPSTESLAWTVEASSPVFRESPVLCESLVASVGLHSKAKTASAGSRSFVDAIEQKVAHEVKKI
jgi:hypothetical protein